MSGLTDLSIFMAIPHCIGHCSFVINLLVLSPSRVWLFCDPMDNSPPGPCVHGIFQARILEWVAISWSHCKSFNFVLFQSCFGCSRSFPYKFENNVVTFHKKAYWDLIGLHQIFRSFRGELTPVLSLLTHENSGSLHLFVVAQLLSRIQLLAIPRTAAHQAPLSSTISWSLLRSSLISVSSVL